MAIEGRGLRIILWVALYDTTISKRGCPEVHVGFEGSLEYRVCGIQSILYRNSMNSRIRTEYY